MSKYCGEGTPKYYHNRQTSRLTGDEIEMIYVGEHPSLSNEQEDKEIEKLEKQLWDEPTGAPTTKNDASGGSLTEGYCQFNLNDYILVQITDYGWKELEKHEQKTNNVGFVEHCIKSKKEVVDGVDYYRLQAHNIPDFFGDMVWASFPAPIKPIILVETKSLYRGSAELKLHNDALAEMNGYYSTFCESLESENKQLKESVEALKNCLNTVMKSLATYGKHPLIEETATRLLNK